jgi:hypothetical protein
MGFATNENLDAESMAVSKAEESAGGPPREMNAPHVM